MHSESKKIQFIKCHFHQVFRLYIICKMEKRDILCCCIHIIRNLTFSFNMIIQVVRRNEWIYIFSYLNLCIHCSLETNRPWTWRERLIAQHSSITVVCQMDEWVYVKHCIVSQLWSQCGTNVELFRLLLKDLRKHKSLMAAIQSHRSGCIHYSGEWGIRGWSLRGTVDRSYEKPVCTHWLFSVLVHLSKVYHDQF